MTNDTWQPAVHMLSSGQLNVNGTIKKKKEEKEGIYFCMTKNESSLA